MNTSYSFYKSKGAPIKVWDRGVEVDPKALEQLRNVASLPFIYKHVAAMPDVHWGIGATIGSVIPTKGAIVPAALGVDIGCFVGETKIPLLDGTQATLQELTERKDPFWVYSIDENGSIVPGRARAVKTRTDASLLRIVVSGGEEIVCTPDHEFMLSDGTYRRADELKYNDSLMPLYRRWQKRDGYESVSNGRGRTRLTHEMVFEHLHGKRPEGHVIHHKNHCHFDNQPENLVLMTIEEHSRHHRETGQKFANDDPDFQIKRQEGIDRRKNDPVARQKMAALRWHKDRVHGYNHKVRFISTLAYTADVYCLQVEKHHNFALAAGVFVHNCGMMAVRLDGMTSSDLPDNLKLIRNAIENAVPVGRGRHMGSNPYNLNMSDDPLQADRIDRMQDILDKHPKMFSRRKLDFAELTLSQLGTLGGGNHFIEVCLDSESPQGVWIMLHSGSRGVGNTLGNYFIELARQDMRTHFINLPDRDLAYFPEGTEHFDDYMVVVDWAQDYARANRLHMMHLIVKAIMPFLPKFVINTTAVQCHHNYVARENHYGSNVFVTRKGAVRARDGDMGIIPGSMGTRSYIVRGKGSHDSFQSCSHGAGRRMSRGEARRTITVTDHEVATTGVECRKDTGVLDESPAAYKDIDAVMEAQKDLVDIVYTLKQVICVKG